MMIVIDDAAGMIKYIWEDLDIIVIGGKMDIVERLLSYRPPYGWPEEYSIIVEPTLNHVAAAEIERLRGMLISALDGLDDYWVTLPQGVELVNQIKALQQKEKE